MSKNQEKKKDFMSIIVIAVLVLSIVAVVVALVSQNKVNQMLTSAISEVNETVTEIKSKQENEDLDSKIIKGIEHYIEAQVQESVDLKYSAYDLASDDVKNGKWKYGNPNARFTLVELSDYECPFCSRFHSTPKRLVDASKGNVNWEWKHLPLSFHNPAARMEAEAAECIAEQKGNKGFWVASEEIFATTSGNGKGVPNITDLAASLGADTKVFQECMSEGRYSDKIDADISFAAQNGVTGTPATFVVDNQTGLTQLLKGAQPAEAITAVIKAMMQNSADE